MIDTINKKGLVMYSEGNNLPIIPLQLKFEYFEQYPYTLSPKALKLFNDIIEFSEIEKAYENIKNKALEIGVSEEDKNAYSYKTTLKHYKETLKDLKDSNIIVEITVKYQK